MKVWVLETGCRYEGGHVVAIFGSEEAGLAGALKYMQSEIDDDVRIYTSDDWSPEEGLTVNGFYCVDSKPGVHEWSEHFVFNTRSKDGKLWPFSGGSMYVTLREHDLQW